MTVIICGSRGITSQDVTLRAIKASGFDITEIISGNAPQGPDQHAKSYGRLRGIKVILFPARWNSEGKQAGVLRNIRMAEYAASKGGACIAVWDGFSRGTQHMIEQARQHGLKLHIHNYRRRKFNAPTQE